MSTPVEDSMQGLVVILDEANIRLQTEVASLTMLLYDWMLTLNLEVNYVWKRGFSIPKALYLVTRWFPIISEGFGIAVQSLPNPSLKMCRYYLSIWLPGTQTAQIFIVQLILVHRIYALYNRNKHLLRMLLVLLLFTSVAATTTISIQIREEKASIINELAPGIPICGLSQTNNLDFAWAYWLPIIVFESVAFSLVAYKAIKQWGVKMLPEGRSATIGGKLVAVLFYDSFLYFTSVFILFGASTFLFRYTSYSIFSITLGPVFALISILACHMILNLPSAYEKTRQGHYHTPPIPLSAITLKDPSTPVPSSVDKSTGGILGVIDSPLSSIVV
ncbi:hypothetical protein SISSUDRAFT_1046683 [Sistotremastrum suecicum HHB10207 ss-3]|uniref:DUF6533 domain-containing protein n=1 Tax=Sistotremastrum suecicum HHB10207 ss-3 TaxID=1314776 RepID=A0A166DLX2_9AGAM|nr:hypothetical protein SISSUDRAFT_1046683 [Sistotremastrum suecicum HHB10207 ss-3]